MKIGMSRKKRAGSSSPNEAAPTVPAVPATEQDARRRGSR